MTNHLGFQLPLWQASQNQVITVSGAPKEGNVNEMGALLGFFSLFLDQNDDGQVNGSIFQNEAIQQFLDKYDDGKENNSFQSYMAFLQNPYQNGSKPYNPLEAYNVFGVDNLFANQGYNPQLRYNPNEFDYQNRNYTVNPGSIQGSTLGVKAANAALSQVGVTEGSGQHTRYGGGANDPWCAHFVSWAFEQANGGRAPWGHQASVQGILDWGQKNNRFISKDQAAGNVQPGDVIIYKSNGASHTGIVTRVNPDGSINTVEGNTSDAVRERTVTLDNAKLTGFVRPT